MDNANFILAIHQIELRRNHGFFGEQVNKDYQVAAKVQGFITNLECFSYAFFLNTVISIFERIEILNTSLQSQDLSVCEAHEKVDLVFDYLSTVKEEKFEEVWELIMKDKDRFDLEEPKIPRSRQG